MMSDVNNLHHLPSIIHFIMSLFQRVIDVYFFQWICLWHITIDIYYCCDLFEMEVISRTAMIVKRQMMIKTCYDILSRVGVLTPHRFSVSSVPAPPELVFMPHFLHVVVEVEALGPPHVLILWLGVRKGMVPVKYFSPAKPLFVSAKFHGDHTADIKMREIWPPSVLELVLKQ